MTNESAGFKKFKINDLIFKELIRRGYSLEGSTRVWNVADSKLWYLTPEQAKAFLDMEKYDPVQKMFVKKETSLIKSNFSKIVESLNSKKINIIDLGCGNGEKALAFASSFKDKSKIRYCPIDINQYMVSEAFKTFSKAKKVEIVRFKHNLLDFFDLYKATSAIRTREFNTNFLLLLGGNLENSDVHDLLHDIKRSMRKGDYLLVGNKLANVSVKVILDYYQKSRHIDKLLMKTLTQIGFGKDEVKYGARFNGERIEMFYTVKKAKAIECCKKRVTFNVGDKIIVAISYKYNKAGLMKLMKLYFRNSREFVSKDGMYALVLCKR